jgi:hypothetical protein
VTFIVTAKAERPANKGSGVCFYCSQPFGDPHRTDCVLVVRKIRVRATIEYGVSLPAHWDATMVEFSRNEASWCANNILDELQLVSDESKEGCLCSSTRFEVVSIDAKPFLSEDGL